MKKINMNENLLGGFRANFRIDQLMGIIKFSFGLNKSAFLMINNTKFILKNAKFQSVSLLSVRAFDARHFDVNTLQIRQ